MTSTSTTISENCTYIQNPSYPSVYSETSALKYTINKCSSSVCAVRLDFETFATAGPSATTETSGGVCTDSFVVTGTSGLSTPVICGSNAGQHSKKNKIHIQHFKVLDPCAFVPSITYKKQSKKTVISSYTAEPIKNVALRTFYICPGIDNVHICLAKRAKIHFLLR